MKHRYQVKFQWKGKSHYGIVSLYSNEAKDAAKSGNLLIEDAVTPQRFIVADDANVVDVPSEEYYKFLDTEFEKATQVSKEAVSKKKLYPHGVVPGMLFSVGVADGSAWYVVKSVSKTGRCKIEWRGFCPDRWTDHYFGYGETVSAQKIAAYVSQIEWLANSEPDGR
jgi:hypothetical protein